MRYRSSAMAIPPARISQLRPRPEDFLTLLERGKRGRLKLYIGFAAGVGKTYRMLEEAHDLLERKVDVVVGYVETHGRAETAALVEGLPAVPRRQVTYRGVTVEEMDLDAILDRKPAVAVVDELAHTNLPVCRNRKRYQDVQELLAAGISVIGAFNVQHLESLNDLVERATGVAVRETIPDSFLQLADQVVNLDLAVEDLQDRLRAGKIYLPEKIPQALEQFFQRDNLVTLRELALREVAESLERSSTRGRTEAEATQQADRCLSCHVHPIYNRDLCVLCARCADICPENCISFVPLERLILGAADQLNVVALAPADQSHTAFLYAEDRCIRCALCAIRCPTGAITMERFRFEEVSDVPTS